MPPPPKSFPSPNSRVKLGSLGLVRTPVLANLQEKPIIFPYDPQTPRLSLRGPGVGQERLKLVLILNAINPLIGGVLIRGEKGTAKSTAALGAAAAL